MKKFFLLFCLFALVGCQAEIEEKPEDLISQQTMTSILADIHIAEAKVEAMAIHPDTARVLFNRLHKEALWKHEVSKAQFDSSYVYYQENLLQLDKIYEALIDTLGMREIKMSSK